MATHRRVLAASAVFALLSLSVTTVPSFSAYLGDQPTTDEETTSVVTEESSKTDPSSISASEEEWTAVSGDELTETVETEADVEGEESAPSDDDATTKPTDEDSEVGSEGEETEPVGEGEETEPLLPTLAVERDNCLLQIDASHLPTPGSYAIEIYDDGAVLGTYDFDAQEGDTDWTAYHTITRQFLTEMGVGIGIYLMDSQSNTTIAQIDPYDFPDSATITRECEATANAGEPTEEPEEPSEEPEEPSVPTPTPSISVERDGCDLAFTATDLGEGDLNAYRVQIVDEGEEIASVDLFADDSGTTASAWHTITRAFDPTTPGVDIYLRDNEGTSVAELSAYDFPLSGPITAACAASEGQSTSPTVSVASDGCSLNITTTGLQEPGDYSVIVSDDNATLGNYPFTLDEGEVSATVAHSVISAPAKDSVNISVVRLVETDIEEVASHTYLAEPGAFSECTSGTIGGEPQPIEPSEEPTVQPTPDPEPSAEPTETPSEEPTTEPTPEPEPKPSVEPEPLPQPSIWIDSKGCSLDIAVSSLLSGRDYSVIITDANSTLGNYPFTLADGEQSAQVTHPILTAPAKGPIKVTVVEIGEDSAEELAVSYYTPGPDKFKECTGPVGVDPVVPEPTPEPTVETTPEPTPEPTVEPTPEPSVAPEPSPVPSPEPSPRPSVAPNVPPSQGPATNDARPARPAPSTPVVTPQTDELPFLSAPPVQRPTTPQPSYPATEQEPTPTVVVEPTAPTYERESVAPVPKEPPLKVSTKPVQQKASSINDPRESGTSLALPAAIVGGLLVAGVAAVAHASRRPGR
ncbi:MAG: hypothetical protein Q4P71_01260 [Actinomycetaceae bacterium]|nr:hypothetical protein [Actinomycetaceae bacterium]